MEVWLTSKEFRNKYQMSSATLWRRVHIGNVKTKTLYGTTYYLDEDTPSDATMNVIYCRVSNTKQQKDLKRQEQVMREYCVSNGIVPDLVLSDIASGMNESRKGLQELIKLVKEGKVKTVFVSYKDRLTRFGFEYFVYLFGLYGTDIKVVNLTTEEDFQQELTQDFISILHDFSMKLYSNRRKELKKLKSELESEVEKTPEIPEIEEE